MPAPRRLSYPEALASLASKGIRIQDASVRQAVQQLAKLDMIVEPRARTVRPRRQPIEQPQLWVRALAHEGWTTDSIAEATGLSHNTVDVVRSGFGRSTVSRHTFDAISSLYEDALAPIHISEAAAAHARASGWLTREQLLAGVQTPGETVG